MDTQKLWPEITLAGFLYVASGCFILMRSFGIYSLSFITDYLPYFSVTLVGLSYCFGFAINIVSHRLIAIKWPQHAYDPNDEIYLSSNIDEATKRRVTSSYFTLLLMRHLTFGSVLLEDCLTFWLSGTHFNWHATAVIIPFSAAAVLFGSAYWIHRENHQRLDNDVHQRVAHDRRDASGVS